MGHQKPMRIGRTFAAVLLVSLFATSLGCESHRSETSAPSSKISIDSKFLNESREIWIHFPSAYAKSEKKYPVLYVLDAELIYDFAAGSVEFLSGELAGRMPEMIVVGIPNTNRVRDLTVSFDTTAAFVNFMGFIESELIPRVDSTYRTNSHRVLYGWSSGSNICLWMLFTKPHLFQGYIASGTGISKRGFEFAEGKFSKHSYNWKSFFASSEGDAPFRVEALHLLSDLLEKSSPEGLRWECVVMEDDDHTAVLPKSLLAGLEFLYSDCRLPTDIAVQGRTSVMKYYHDLSNDYGFDISITEGAASDAAFQLIDENRVDEAIEIFKLGIEEHPESAGLYTSLGEVYEMMDRVELAVGSFQSALEIARKTQDTSLPAFESNLKRAKKKLDEN